MKQTGIASKWLDDGDDSASQREKARTARVERVNHDPEFFCSHYLPHYFPTPLAGWQHSVIEKADDDSVPQMVDAAPRGHGKTTLINFALTLRDVLRRKCKFVVLIAATYKSACDRITEIRTELEENEKIREDFGDLLTSEKRALKSREDDLELANGCRIVARGAMQSMRGVKNRENRPDRVVIDDIDKDEEASNPERVEKKWNWYNRVVMGLSGSGFMKVIVIGNIIARNTFLTKCLDSKSFSGRVWSAIQQDGTPLMPLLWTIAKLHAKRDAIGTDSFNTEYQNNPPSIGTRPFREAWLKQRWGYEELARADAGVVMSLDLSAAKTDQSDYQSIMAVRRDKDGRIYLIKADLGRRTRKELARRVIAFAQAIGVERIVSFVVEDNGFQEWFREEMTEAAAAAGCDLPARGVTHTTSKFDRISKMAPIFEGARFFFPPEELEDESVKLLRSQLERFPDDKHDDGPDGLAMAVEESARRVRESSARTIDVNPWDRQDTGNWDGRRSG